MNSTPTPPLTLLTPNHLALILRSLRKSKGWTQADLAKRLNVSQQSVSRMEVNADNLSWARLHHVLSSLALYSAKNTSATLQKFSKISSKTTLS